MNADGYVSTGTGLLGYNMYAYCNNNPVNKIDSKGTWSRWITVSVAVLSLVVCVGATVTGMAPLAAAAYKVAAISIAVLAVQNIHYDYRQSQNDGVPLTLEEAKNTPDFDDTIAAEFHQFSADKDNPNQKICWPDGKEAIYNSSGNIVTDSRDVGTYNFFVPTNTGNTFLHVLFDVVPWFVFGNDDDDLGPIVNYPQKWITEGF